MLGQHPNVLLPPSQERRVIRVRRHWAVLSTVLLQTVGIVVGAFLLSQLLGRLVDDPSEVLRWLPHSLLWYLAVAAVVRLAWRVLEWWHEVFVVTDKRFMVTSGIIETKNAMMPIGKVTDVSFKRPFIGQLLGYGTLRVESAGQIQDLETIDYLPGPDEVFYAISELVFGEKGKTRSHMLAPPRIRRRRGRARRPDPAVRTSP